MLVVELGVVRADVYSWTDEDGVVHFTNIKPHGGKWKRVRAAGSRLKHGRDAP